MTKEFNPVKRIVAVLFVIMLAVGFILNKSWLSFGAFSEYIFSSKQGGEEEASFEAIETGYTDTLWKQSELIDLNGLVAKGLNIHGLYSDMGMYVTDENYIVSASDYTSTDYETEETVSFHEFLKSEGINLLYVNEPTKYTDDELFKKEFGIETYSNRNMDRFLERLSEAGVPAIDLRESIREDNLNIYDLFYRTDHHWTVPAGLWAAGKIAEGLNRFCGYNIDLSAFDEENYVRTDRTQCWIGEQGRKLAKTYVGLDDYTELKPEFKTEFLFKNPDGSLYSGTFDEFVNEETFNTDKDVYDAGSWHYAYGRKDCINESKTGKILMLVDSYDNVVQPFLALQVGEIDSFSLRSKDDSFELRDYILKGGYDTVLVTYAQFMLGAHDDPESSNYRMFVFDK